MSTSELRPSKRIDGPLITGRGLAIEPFKGEETMNSLRYTNAMLTIIALAFSVIAVENFIRPTVAQPPTTQIQPVAICDTISHVCLDVERSHQGSFLNARAVR
jgi:hypothetical protein